MFGLQMGFSKKSQVDMESDGKKWVIAGLPARASLKAINTRPRAEDDGEKSRPMTPTAKEARISEKLACPPAPRKRRSQKSSSNHVREFFNPPDLESVFMLRAEKAS